MSHDPYGYLKPVMATLMVLSVRPTDRALAGWCPFGDHIGRALIREESSVAVMEFFRDCGAT